MTQNEMILQHLKEKGSITSAEAFTLYGVTRLSARIYDLRRYRHCIRNDLQEKENRFGKKVWFDRYILEET